MGSGKWQVDRQTEGGKEALADTDNDTKVKAQNCHKKERVIKWTPLLATPTALIAGQIIIAVILTAINFNVHR